MLKALGAKTVSLSYHGERHESNEMVRRLGGALYHLERGLIDKTDRYIYTPLLLLRLRTKNWGGE